MEKHSYTETETVGLFSRLGKSIKNVGGGLLLFVLAFPTLFGNEGCAVKTAKSLDEGQGQVQSVAADKVDQSYDGKLVHTNAKAKTDETLTDETFGVSASGLKLLRMVEMYQWDENKKTETTKKVGGSEERTTTYTYKRKWSPTLINSGIFKMKQSDDGRTFYTNPRSMPYDKAEYMATRVSAGAFQLPEVVVQKITHSEALPVNDATLKALPKELKHRAAVDDGALYIGHDPANPVVGDVRIRWHLVPAGDISLVAQQTADTFAAFPTQAGDSILLVTSGTKTAVEMFAAAQQANVIKTWFVRLFGLMMMFFGLTLLFKPLVVVADTVPFVGNILNLGVNVFAAMIAGPLTLITIAVAWIFYRPMVGVPLLLLGVAALVAVNVMAKKKKAEPLPAMA